MPPRAARHSLAESASMPAAASTNGALRPAANSACSRPSDAAMRHATAREPGTACRHWPTEPASPLSANHLIAGCEKGRATSAARPCPTTFYLNPPAPLPAEARQRFSPGARSAAPLPGSARIRLRRSAARAPSGGRPPGRGPWGPHFRRGPWGPTVGRTCSRSWRPSSALPGSSGSWTARRAASAAPSPRRSSGTGLRGCLRA